MSPSWHIKSDVIYPAADNPFNNNFYGYRSTNLALPDGSEAIYHGVVMSDCLHIVAVEDDLTTYMVRQNRPNARIAGSDHIPQTLELPGGFQQAGLEKQAAANKELIEEIGKSAGSLMLIGRLYPSPGISNETDTIFLAKDLTSRIPLEETEATEQDMRIIAEPFGKLYDSLIHGNQPVSAQTLAAMTIAASHI